MVRCSSPLLIVFKRTGGRQWLKPWGHPGLTKHQKARKRRRDRRSAENRAALTVAEQSHWQYLRETGQTPHWGESAEIVRQRKLQADQRWRYWKATRDKYLPSLSSLHQAILQESSRA